MIKKHILILALTAWSMLSISTPVYADNVSSSTVIEDDYSAEDEVYAYPDDTDSAENVYEVYTEPEEAAEVYTMGEKVANYASLFIGNPYRYGGISLTGGADCSGFLMSVYSVFGVSLPHSSSAMRSVGTDVSGLYQALPGDILCYSGHVGIYLGNGQMLSALNKNSGITITDANYKKIRAIRRVF